MRRKALGCHTQATLGSTCQTPWQTSADGVKSSMLRSPSAAMLSTRLAPIRMEPSPPTHSSINSRPLAAAGRMRLSVRGSSRSPPTRTPSTSGASSKLDPLPRTPARAWLSAHSDGSPIASRRADGAIPLPVNMENTNTLEGFCRPRNRAPTAPSRNSVEALLRLYCG
eukprot:scaffold157571_cov35-Tisochrysis_lutea.AAC.4